MITEKLSYHKAAGKFIKAYYEANAANTLSFSCRFINGLAFAGKKISKSLHLEGMDYQNAMVAVWFRFAGATEMGVGRTEAMRQVLNDFFTETNYPEEERSVVEEAIDVAIENKYPGTKVQQAVSDAINSLLADPELLQNIVLIKEEMNALNGVDRVELFYLDHFLTLFVKTRYYTEYANENYSPGREKNFQLLEKRIRKVGDMAKATERLNGQLHHGSQLTNKETEDLFKIAFRNYNQLISVADAKASLLINVNSIIISVMLAFVLSKVEKNTFLLWPAILLLVVCMATILLSILASRPQKNSLVEDKSSHSYQRFFFGSFDLIDPSFRSANWEEYYRQLNELFNNSKEAVYMEIYKESYNVRKVLSKKFNYLSKAYWVFIIGLVLSVIAFIIAIQSQTITQ